MSARAAGNIDHCDQHRLVGWTSAPSVDVYVNGENCGQGIFGDMRDDLVAQGISTARIFVFTFPRPLWLHDRVTLRLPDNSILAPSQDVSHVTRLSMFVSDLDLTRPGLEFGPLHRPAISREHAEVYYVDHADQESLRRDNTEGLGEEIAKIPPIDFVWADGAPLSDVVQGRRFAWVVASHVGEHIPDFVGWIQQLGPVLEDQGRVSLILPHGERTFDSPRPVSTFQDLVADHIMMLERPSPRQVVSHLMGVAKHRGNDLTTPENAGKLMNAVGMARLAHYGSYVDVHCNVFTPASFTECYHLLARCGLVALKLDCVIETNDAEFFVRLVRE